MWSGRNEKAMGSIGTKGEGRLERRKVLVVIGLGQQKLAALTYKQICQLFLVKDFHISIRNN